MMVLRRIKGENRERKGCGLSNAYSVGLLYLERDHSHYRAIKDIAKYLNDEVGVKKVSMLSYVDNDKKHIPGWLVKKLDSGYFCKSDLNWYGKPQKEVQSFIDYEFDILLDLELEPVLPLKYVLMRSMAKMKVVAEQPEWGVVDYDFQVIRDNRFENLIEDGDLKTPKDIWKNHMDMTFKILSEMNIT
tara:strand:+ start:319 stop:882 length:564 start_codon:yes stop_codon:yes gene_type:complete